MRYCLLSGGVITNIIVCASDEIAALFGVVPSYDGARIGDAYAPPPPPEPEPEPEPEPTEVQKLRAQVADLQNQILTMRLGG